MAEQAWLITDPDAEAGGRETLPPTDGLVVMTREELAASDLRFDEGTKVAITSEAAMDEVLGRLDPLRREAVGNLKDKAAFRKLLEPLFPDVTFETVPMAELESLELDPAATYVVKPALGVFGAGVRTIRGDADLAALRDDMSAEIARNAEVLSETALSGERLVVERYIEGEEYAADAFFDSSGNPVVTSVYHHPMPEDPAYLHMLYSTSRDVMAHVEPQAKRFFAALNESLGVTDIAVHAEFRLEEGRLVPIEINSMRFGGMGLGNMVFHAYGVNPYRHFIDDSEPDWSALESDERSTLFFIAYNGKSVDPSSSEPDRVALRELFSEVILEVPFDHRTQPAFGILYAREPQERIAELLGVDFDDLFT